MQMTRMTSTILMALAVISAGAADAATAVSAPATTGANASAPAHASARTAGEAPQADQQNGVKKPEELQAIEVVGARQIFNRSAVFSQAPVDVISSKTLISTGAPNLTSALRILVPALNFDQPTNVDVTSAVRPIQLRGLSPDQTIVLIDGHRAHNTSTLGVDLETFASGSSGFDLNSIPMNAVARVKVLRDGAAAQFGSGAIAGVINIILKKGAQGGSASVQYGAYTATGGATWQGSADGGFAIGKGNRGWIHVSANYIHQNPTNWAGPDLEFPGDPTFGKVNFHSGLSKDLTKQLAINGQYDVTDTMQLYGYWIYSKRRSTAFDFYRSSSQYSSVSPAALQIYPNGYSPEQANTLTDSYAVFGIRGKTVGDWNYNLSVNDGFNHSKLNLSNTFNYSLDSLFGTSAPTSFYLGTTAIQNRSVSATFSRTFRPAWLPHPLHVGWGLDYRDAIYSIKPGEPLSYFVSGSQGFAGFQPSDSGAHTRQSRAAFVDFSMPITNRLDASLSARYAKYSDFGHAVPADFSFRYQLPHSWAIRGSVGTGFRAPSLQQEWYQSTETNTITNPQTGQLVLENIRDFAVTNPAAVALGAKPLKAEKSRSASIGVVYAPNSGFIATIDAYQVYIENRIVESGFLAGSDVASFLSSIGIEGVEGGSFFTNAVDTRTTGIGVVTSYPITFASGDKLTLTASGNFGFTDITHVEPAQALPALGGAVLPVLTVGSRANVNANTPRSRVIFGATWEMPKWTFAGRLVRYGKFGELYPTEFSEPQMFGAQWVLDGSATYLWQHDVAFTVGVNNLADNHPTANDLLNSDFGNFPYPRNSPMNNNGTFYYARVTYSW